MKYIIRQAKPADDDQIERLTREAFWNVYKPGCDEHLVVHNIHKEDKSLKELELVACQGERVVGHIIYTKSRIEGCDKNGFITFGPISVKPQLQKQGIGSRLIEASMKLAAKEGYLAVFITGNPAYYHKFGFESASKYKVYLKGIPMEQEAEFFMVKALQSDALAGISGNLVFDSCFEVNPEELEVFDKQFPSRIKEVREGQLPN